MPRTILHAAAALWLLLAVPALGAAPPPPFVPVPPPPAHRPNSLGADWRLQQDEVRLGVQKRQLMPLGRLIEKISRRTPGRQLDTGLEEVNGRPTYRVRWMTRDGRRIDYLIDATSGAILRGD
jgi:hypothetical protein